MLGGIGVIWATLLLAEGDMDEEVASLSFGYTITSFDAETSHVHACGGNCWLATRKGAWFIIHTSDRCSSNRLPEACLAQIDSQIITSTGKK